MVCNPGQRFFKSDGCGTGQAIYWLREGVGIAAIRIRERMIDRAKSGDVTTRGHTTANRQREK